MPIVNRKVSSVKWVITVDTEKYIKTAPISGRNNATAVSRKDKAQYLLTARNVVIKLAVDLHTGVDQPQRTEMRY